MKHTLIGMVGGNNDALFAGLREFNIAHLILIINDDAQREEAESIKERIRPFNIPTSIMRVQQENIIESFFSTIDTIKQTFQSHDLIINVDSGTSMINCAALSAAYVNGIKAFVVENNQVSMLPIMRFTYSNVIGDRKMFILKHLFKKDFSSYQELSEITDMSLPLTSYHINGNLKSEGLVTLGLVDAREEHGKVHLKITQLGKLIVRGYIVPETLHAKHH